MSKVSINVNQFFPPLTAEHGIRYQHAINKLFSNNNTFFEYCLK